MRDALFVLALAFRRQTHSPLLCRKRELGEWQGIVEHLKCCWKKKPVSSFSKDWKWLLCNSGGVHTKGTKLLFLCLGGFVKHYSVFSSLKMHDSRTAQIGNGRDWSWEGNAQFLPWHSLVGRRVLREVVTPKLIGSYRFESFSSGPHWVLRFFLFIRCN